MSDVTNPGADEAPQEVADELVDERELDTTSEDNAGDDDQPQTDDDTDEVDYEGQKYRVPKALKDAVLRYADYTQKTQEVAASRRELDQQREQLTQQSEAQRANIRAHAQLANIESELETYSKVDWAALYAQDAALAAQHSHRQNELRNAHQNLGAQITQHEKQALEKQTAERSKRIQESDAVLAREIKDWSPEKASKFVDLSRSLGDVPPDVLAQGLMQFPKFAKVLDLALIGQQFLAKQTSAPKSAPAVEAKPVPNVGKGKSAPAALDDRISTDEWMRRRAAQLRKGG